MISCSKKIVPAVFLAALTTGPALAVDYVESPPIAKLSLPQVRDCRSGSSFELPLITWGADIVTIHANGGSKRTTGNSLFGKAGLKVELKREDVFVNQLKKYLSCETPFLRATAGMANLVANVTQADPRTEMIAIYQHSWSAGGDALVVRGSIKKPSDLVGKTIAVQRYGPHVDYLMTVLNDAGIDENAVTIKWTNDLVGFSGSTPAAALQQDSGVDAAMVIIPDALALTSGGGVGTGSEDSVQGAEILLSTKTANRVIADLYLVRRDFYESNRSVIQSLVANLMKAEEEVRSIMKARGAETTPLVRASAEILLDDGSFVEDTVAMWADAETVGWKGNVKFFADNAFPRRFSRVNTEIQATYMALGFLSSASPVVAASIDYGAIAPLLDNVSKAEVSRFDTDAVERVVTRKRAQDTLDEGTLFEFEVNFKPNQKGFSLDIYREPFERAIDLASTYGGAVITIEGHADPLAYLKAKKKGRSSVELSQIAQSARNLSYARGNAVRSSVIDLAAASNIVLDTSQFVVLGHGFMQPRTGMCGEVPCAPKTEAEWLSNMRVTFRILQVEAEAEVFVTLD